MAPELGGSGGCIMYCKLGSMSYVCIFTPTMFSFFAAVRRLRGTNYDVYGGDPTLGRN